MRQLQFVSAPTNFNPGVNVTVRSGHKWDDLEIGERVKIVACSTPHAGKCRILDCIPVGTGTILGVECVEDDDPVGLLRFEHEPTCRTWEGLVSTLKEIYGPNIMKRPRTWIVFWLDSTWEPA